MPRPWVHGEVVKRVKAHRFRLMPAAHLTDREAAAWLEVLRYRGLAYTDRALEDTDAFAELVEPYLVAVDDAIRQFNARVPQ